MRRPSMLAVLIVVAAASFGGSYAFASPTPAPNVRPVPDNAQRCTQVFCVPQVVPRGPANRPAPNVRPVPDNAQRCTQVFCVPQVVPRGPA